MSDENIYDEIEIEVRPVLPRDKKEISLTLSLTRT
jgi:hypothetical protein